MSDEGLIPVPDDLDFAPTLRGFVAGQKLFNRFALGRVVGRGGMGLVWAAKDEELDEEIALKFLPEVLRMDATALEELKRETRRSRKLAHAHIVKVYDFIANESAAAISMELVNGDSLANLRAKKKLLCFEVQEIENWIKQLLSALSYAHDEARIVHRDLKPANVMVDREGGIKVTDFGISSSISESVSRVTIQRGTSGTLAYMSPQQAMGTPPSTKDDIYAFGATVYDLLTSRPPFYGSSSVAVLAQLREVVPPSMAQRRMELGVQGEPIPPQWEQTIAACLAKDPAQRPASMAVMVELLRSIPVPIILPPLPSAPSLPLPPPENIPGKASGKGWLIGLGVGILVLVLGGLGYYFGVKTPEEKVLQAETAQREADAQVAEAEAEKLKADEAADAAAAQAKSDQEKADLEKAKEDADVRAAAAEQQAQQAKADADAAKQAADAAKAQALADSTAASNQAAAAPEAPAAPAPTPTPPPSPPAPDDHGLNAAVQKWCQDNSSNDPSVWAADFASQVNYCYYEGSGLASQNFIEEDRRKLVDAWPQRTYTFNTVTSSLINDHQANANVKFDWSYSSPAKGDRSGNCDVELSLTWNGSNWLIDSYQETVHRQ